MTRLTIFDLKSKIKPPFLFSCSFTVTDQIWPNILGDKMKEPIIIGQIIQQSEDSFERQQTEQNPFQAVLLLMCVLHRLWWGKKSKVISPLHLRWPKIAQLQSSTQPPKTLKSHFTRLIFWQPCSSLTLSCANLNGFSNTTISQAWKQELACFIFSFPSLCPSLPHVSLLPSHLLQLGTSPLSVCVGMPAHSVLRNINKCNWLAIGHLRTVNCFLMNRSVVLSIKCKKCVKN